MMEEHWYALYVNSRAEIKVAERLQEQGWEVFCPVKTEVRQWSDRKKRVTVPYFRSYVFVRFSIKKDKLKVLQTPGVVRLLFWMGRPAVIRDDEMEAVKGFFEQYKSASISTEKIETGRAYQVQHGVLAGKSGIVIWQNSDRAILEIPGFNMRFSVRKTDLHVSTVK